MYPLAPDVLMAPHLVVAGSVAAAYFLAGPAVVHGVVTIIVSTANVATGAVGFVANLVKRRLHHARRRKTAKALHALRHDREYLLGRLPPVVTSQVLGGLDHASLASLRRACRQSCLLVSWGAKRLRLSLAGVAHYSQVPIEAVWPCLQVLSLSLDATRDGVGLWLRPQDKPRTPRAPPSPNPASSSQPSQLGSNNSNNTSTGTTSNGMANSSSVDPGADCLVADAALLALVTAPGGLTGLERLRVVDLTPCTASFSPDTWHALARALPDGCRVVAPVRALLGAHRNGYMAPVCRAASVLSALAAWGRGARGAGKPGARVYLQLVGGGVEVPTPSAMSALVAVVPQGGLVSLGVLDTWLYTGGAGPGWAGLAQGAGTGLQELRAVPATRESLTQLLSALPQLPALTTLTLHSATGPRWVSPSSQPSATPPPPGATITPNELTALARATSLSRLEVHTLSLPGPNDRQTADLSLPNLRSLATYNLHTSHRQGADRLGSLFPALINLSLGACPHSSQSEVAGLTASEAGARAATEVAVANAAAKGDGPLSEAALLSAPALLPVLARLSNLETLDLGPVAAAVVAKELTQGAVPQVSLPCLRHLSLHHIPNYEQLCVLLRLLVHLPKLHSLSLHFCCLGKQAVSTQGAGNGAGGVGGGGILAGAAAVLGLGVGLGPVGGGPPAVHAAAAGAGEDGDGFGPKDVALRIAAAPGLTTVTLEGCEYRLLHHLASLPAYYTHLHIRGCGVTSVGDVIEAAEARTETDSPACTPDGRWPPLKQITAIGCRLMGDGGGDWGCSQNQLLGHDRSSISVVTTDWSVGDAVLQQMQREVAGQQEGRQGK